LANGPVASLIRRPAHENLPGTVRWAEKRPGGRRPYNESVGAHLQARS